MAFSMLAQPTAAQKLLQWRFQAGESIQVSFTQDMTVQMTAMGQPMETSADMGMYMRWNVLSVAADGTADIHQSIDRLSMKMQTPGTDPIAYDSAQTEEPVGMAVMLAATVDPMVGVEFTQKMSPAGEILDVALTERAKQQLAAAPDGAQLKEVLSRDGLKALLSQAATVFPKTPVKPGDTWTGSSESQSPIGKLTTNMQYKYVGTETREGRPLERIDVKMTVGFPDEVKQPGMNIAIQNQQNSGSMYFDAAVGRFVETQLNQNMRLVTTIDQQEHSQLLSTVLRMTFAPSSRVAQAAANVPGSVNSQIQPAGYIRR
jgi:hypothetical protein